ncbi:heterokaryon incompatibility protein-domain-containing protein [Lophiotrema nucula]|uniref:Heterokaryon incompatibility protein-domain-containing protein n=1 Tax=Lophiotrema nucula TaxID=690887 RepID=A0A6A5Z924_9PLEO|nr:heterokaryon incompatibility protein-domain-containing protein [Lophiotrema nucula]
MDTGALFKHELLNLRKRSIRLVNVLPELSNQGRIQLNMSQETIDACYTCLSYVWGPANGEQHEIEIDARVFGVRSNLHGFLAIARTQHWHKSLWIDALCIDQENVNERNHQVQQMGSIYSSATQVLVWLGQKPLVNALFATIHMMKRLYGLAWKAQYMQMPFYKLLHLPNVLLECLADEYWSRAWITQEILLAPKVQLLAGEEAIDLEEIYSFKQNTPAGKQIEGDARIEHFDALGDPRYPREAPTLIGLLIEFRDKSCMIPRDRIFSLLSICGHSRILQVDYSISNTLLLFRTLQALGRFTDLDSLKIVAHSIGWNNVLYEHMGQDEERLYVDLDLRGRVVQKGYSHCQDCSGDTPSKWSRSDGLILCLARACSTSSGHLHWDDQGLKASIGSELHSCGTSIILHNRPPPDWKANAITLPFIPLFVITFLAVGVSIASRKDQRPRPMSRPAPWADGPFPLLKTPSATKDIHHEFAEGLGALHEYSTKTAPKEFCRLIDAFAKPIRKHLADEIATLWAIDSVTTDSAESRKLLEIYEYCEAEAGKQDKHVVSPMVLGLCDKTFEGGNDWPKMPIGSAYLVHYLFGRKHRGAWRFLPCDTWGQPRELAFAAKGH